MYKQNEQENIGLWESDSIVLFFQLNRSYFKN